VAWSLGLLNKVPSSYSDGEDSFGYKVNVLVMKKYSFETVWSHHVCWPVDWRCKELGCMHVQGAM